MKKTTKIFSFNNGFKPVLPRKKRRGGVLEDGSSGKSIGSKVQNSCSWGSETGDITKSDSIDMKKKCLMEETSFDYGKDDVFAKENPDQTPTGSKIKTKKALGKPLGKINFSFSDIDDDVLLDALLELPPPLKNLVNISVYKSFTLDIELNKMVGKSSQEKLQVVRRLFSKINGFGRSLPFQNLLESLEHCSLSNQVWHRLPKKLKKCSDWTVVIKEIPVGTLAEAVCAALSEFGIIKLIKIQLNLNGLIMLIWSQQNDERDVHRALLYTIPVRTNVHDIWDYINLVGRKTCTINHYPVIYAWARCAIVCFKSAESLDAVINTTSCGKIGHMLLSCSVGENFSPSKSPRRVLSDVDKNRLAVIYSKYSALIAHSVAFGGIFWAKIASRSLFPPLSVKNNSINPGSSSEIKPTLPVAFNVEKRFAVLKSSLISLTEQISELAKRLNSLVLAVSQPSPRLGDIVMGEGSSVATNGKTAALLKSFSSPNMVKFKTMLEGLSAFVLSFELVWKIVMCNVRSMNNPAKQKDISDCKPWIINKFDGVRIFSFGVNKGFLGTGVAIIMNNSLACHVSKIDEILGQVISVCLFFKGKLSVMVLDLYTGASSGIRFGQAIEVNSFITRVLNFNTFVVLGVGLGGLLDVHLNGLRKQANKD
ncbi:hypothetical protein G9A89_017720 [Geosiphon pyriformis]|nr:hypothetical protein G9A89_017720 [Geosiphon pyriformis]